MPAEPELVQAIFEKIIELPDSMWQDALEKECGQDSEIREKVLSLLDAQQQTTGYEKPSHSAYISSFDDSDINKTTDLTPESESIETIDFQFAVKPEARINDRYILKKKIGEGGMGEVWIARQTEPVKRDVALKLIKAGMDSRAVLSRFEQERQALALMDHPNIAKVLDAGITQAGHPFFAMELIRGMPLTRFCDNEKLRPKERLELFIPICNAIQHAHQKGIVHRDLKPANILVAMIDGKPVPKVIDFGVAKATGGKITDESMATQLGMVIGTLEYMSPEQAGLANGDVDTRSDIYSLGVILYELLTGLRPFDARRLKNAAITEMIRIIQEEEPSKPSTRLNTDESFPSQAAIRQTEPRKLMAILRGELDWIVLKCLEKSRDRRYETANGLSRDIQRYLSDEPIEARPPSSSYKIAKFYRRNKVVVITSGLVAVSLLVGVITTSLAMFEARRQKTIAINFGNDANLLRIAEQEQRESAEKANRQAIAALNAFTSDVMENLLGSRSEINDREKSILENAMKQWEVFADSKGNSTEAQKIRAEGSRNVSKILYKLGQFEKAIESNRRTLAIWQDLSDQFPEDEIYQYHVADSLLEIGSSLRGIGRRTEAIQFFKKSVDQFDVLAAKNPNNKKYKQYLADAHTSMGNAERDLGKWITSANHYRTALEIQEQLLADDQNSEMFLENIARSHWGLAFLHKRQFLVAESTGHYKKAISTYEALKNSNPGNLHFKITTAGLYREFGVMFYDSGMDQEGAAQLEIALPIQREIVAEFPSVPDYSADLARTLRDLANVYRFLKKYVDADALFVEAINVQEKLTKEFPTVLRYQSGLGLSHRMKGDLQDSIKEFDKALKSYEQGISVLTETLAQDKSYTQVQESLCSCHAHRAETLATLGRYKESLKDWEQVIKLAGERKMDRYRSQHADTLFRSGEYKVAIEKINELSKLENKNATHWFRFAKLYAIASTKIPDKTEEYANQSIKLLEKSIQLGFTDFARFSSDEELAVLKGHDGFQEVVDSLKSASEK